MLKRTPRSPFRLFIALACLILLSVVWVEKSLPRSPVSRPPATEEQSPREAIPFPPRTVAPLDVLVAPSQPDRLPARAPTVLAADWVQTRHATPLQSYSSDPLPLSEPLPEGAYLKVIGADKGRLMVRFGGDGHKLRAGVAWVDESDVSPSSAPRWVATLAGVALRSAPESNAPVSTWVPDRSVLEVLEQRERAVRGYSLGDGLSRAPTEGWMDAGDLLPAGSLLAGSGPRILSRADVELAQGDGGRWLKVPYRTQLDGSVSAAANCGPASVAMAMEHYGIHLTTEELRIAADKLQGTSDPDGGFAIEFLAALLPPFGLRPEGLYVDKQFRRWTMNDLRSQLLAGHPVIPQLKFRLMPGRSDSDYWEDHYVVLTGMLGDDIIYNDAVDVDGPGYGRLMSQETLMKAWGNSYFPFAAFAVSAP
jgi:hypothetical protein